MKRFVAAARRQASTSALASSGVRRPRPTRPPAQLAIPMAALSTPSICGCRCFGATSAALGGDGADAKPKAGLGSDYQPTVPFEQLKKTDADDDWFKEMHEGRHDPRNDLQRGRRMNPHRNRNNSRNNHYRDGRNGGRHQHRAGRHHAGRHPAGRHPAPGRDRHPSNSHHRPTEKAKEKEKKEEPQPRPIATTPWICLQNIPPTSILEDVADCIARVMQREMDSGILDLDKAERAFGEEGKVEETDEGETNATQDETPLASMDDLPFWDPSEHDASLNGSYIQEARLLLSVLGRPFGWYLRMPDRSCVQAILSHADEDAKVPGRRLAVSIGGRTLAVGEFDPSTRRVLSMPESSASDRPLIERSFDRAVALRLDDSVIRVENCPVDSTPADLRYLFRRYDIIDTRRLQDDAELDAVQLLVQGNYGRRKDGGRFYPNRSYHGEDKQDLQPLRDITPVATNTFIVRFESAADARAAIREMQMVELEGRQLRLAQYPKQLLP